MKKTFLFLFLLITELTFAQSTEILPGLILPQMTTAQRTTMVNPADGTLVFDKTTQSYWYRQSDTWAELPKAGSTSNYWQLAGAAGNEIQNTNTGGFWSKNPKMVEYNDPLTPLPVNEAGTRLMWLPGRSAFRAGTIDDSAYWASDSIGIYSFAAGKNVQAKGLNSIAMGRNTIANDNLSVAIGIGAKSTQVAAIAMGFSTQASGYVSTALGYNTEAKGQFSTSLGYNTKAEGNTSVAMGESTTASGTDALSAGFKTTASGSLSFAMGTWLNTNNKMGAFIIGDSDPNDEGETKVGFADQFVARFKNGYYLLTSGDKNRTGASMLTCQTAWNAISDSTRKEKFVAANGEDFLTKLRSLRLGSWNYKNQKTAKPERFYGPMAQEVFAAFGKDTYGTIGTDTTVSTINLDGLLFIFSQTLEKRTADLQADNKNLKVENQALKSIIQQSENKLVAENDKLKAIILQLDARLEKIETNQSLSTTPLDTSKK